MCEGSRNLHLENYWKSRQKEGLGHWKASSEEGLAGLQSI